VGYFHVEPGKRTAREHHPHGDEPLGFICVIPPLSR
jgi:hypothetical protein